MDLDPIIPYDISQDTSSWYKYGIQSNISDPAAAAQGYFPGCTCSQIDATADARFTEHMVRPLIVMV